ncbi:hypothetical protein RhiirA4_132495 [Rhizophagus irregularis]|uniref:Uncharacterized protein n=1 Tax=Rhizophagus irregularis TaxID=588596 RepID=A0A2I1HH38_9GLOM|nr:hypothetical protein RhiirA4_132495 [Rhizophagus irregularis]
MFIHHFCCKIDDSRHIFCVKLLTIDMYRDCDYEIHEGRESIIEFVRPIQQKEADVRRLTVWD